MYKVIRCVCIYTICKIIFIKVSVHSAAVWAGMAPNKACQGFKMAISFRFDTMIRIILPSSITFTWIFGRILPPHPLSHLSLLLDKFLPLIVLELWGSIGNPQHGYITIRIILSFLTHVFWTKEWNCVDWDLYSQHIQLTKQVHLNFSNLFCFRLNLLTHTVTAGWPHEYANITKI